jgi:Rne/Rng family ribonuclease
MSKEMVISANPHETRVAILEEGQLCEYYVEREKEFALVGSIYKGKVTRVLPGMQSAFVEIGLDSDAFLYVSDFLEEIEGLDHVETADEKSSKAAGNGGTVAALPAASIAAPGFEAGAGEAAGFAAQDEHADTGGFGEAGNSAPTIAAPAPSFTRPAPPANRGGFQGRPHGGGSGGGDRGGRNRFGGRGGRNRQGGRGGSGGGRGGDRRFGRELPSSKYASSSSSGYPADSGAEQAGPEGHISTVLPGESLAKFRERPAYAEPSSFGGGADNSPDTEASPEVHENTAQDLGAERPLLDKEASLLSSFGSFDAPAERSSAPPRRDRDRDRFPSRSSGRGSYSSGSESRSAGRGDFSSGSFSSGIEPLPGESLSKWKTHQHLPPEPPSDNSPVPEAVQFASLTPLVPPGAEVDSAHVPAKSEIDETRIFSDTESASERTENDGEREGEETHFLDGGQEAAHHGSASERAESDAEPEIHGSEEVHSDEAHAHGIHAHDDLTDEEVTALAEHIADAQDDLAARDAQERGFAAADAAAEAGVHGLDAEEEHEDAELEEDQAAAEEEGMIAHPELETAGELADEQAIEEQAEGDASHETSEHELGEHEPHSAELEAEAAALMGEDGQPLSAEAGAAQPAQPFQARVRNDFRSRMQNPSRRGGRDRGRRDDRGGRRPHQGHSGHSGGHSHHRPSAPRRTQLIADMLKQGQEIIVQIAKEPLGKKGARITSHVALPGRFLVYMPTLDHNGVSRKIASAEERSRLRHLVNDAKGTAGGGFIVRTAASTADPAEVRADVEFLTRTWAEIKARSDQKKAPALVHRDLNLVQRILRDYITPDFGAIWVDTEEEYTKVVDFMSRFQPQLVGRVKLYTKDTPVFEEFGIQQEIDKGLRPKVWLKSGGYIVINHTEALVAIDVNTGKFVGKGSNRLEDTIVRTNIEACKEIVRQMRLRDLGGIIVIDFIDMEERRNRDKVMATLEDALRADRAPSKVLRFNEFGLVAITRKRTKQALERTLCQPCPYCTGSGMVKSIPTLCYEIQTEARKMAPDLSAGSITLRVHPEISKALKTRESSLIEELEHWTKKSIIIQADPTLHWEQYDIY